MNDFFIAKVQKIISGLETLPVDTNGCYQIMNGKVLKLSMKFVIIATVRKLLKSLKSKTAQL